MASNPIAYESHKRTQHKPREGMLPLAVFQHSILVSFFLFAVDTVCIVLATLVAAFFTMPVGFEGGFRLYYVDHSAYLFVFLLMWVGAAVHEDLLISHRKDSLPSQLLGVSKSVVIALVCTGFIIAFLSRYTREPIYLIYLGLSVLIMVGLVRTILCVTLWTIREHGYNHRHVLIVGANPRTRRLIDTIEHRARFGYYVVGVLENDLDRLEMLREYKVPHLGGFQDLERVLTEYVIDEVHVGLPFRSSYELIQSMAYLCIGVGVSVRMVADLFPLRLATSRVHNLVDIPMLSLSIGPDSGLQLAVKRFIDIVVSMGLLFALSPAFLLVALAIKLDSPGPVFFAQERVGMNRRRFKMLKFRSMVVDAESQRASLDAFNEADGPVFKIRNDPRITRIGAFIRKYSIDEFPQLINVLRGEMSLVGPRPPIASEVEKYSWDQRRRLSVKPGMTGLWQVSGRSDVGFKEWVELDLAYIDSWSLFQDFRILLRTFGAVVQGRGAA